MNSKLASMIDHTLLKVEATADDIKRTCDEAKKYGFATVCVRPNYVSLAASELRGSGVLPIAVVDFPKGNGSPKAKAEETIKVIQNGAQEVDMVLNVEELKQKNYREVFDGIDAVVKSAGKIPVKVILETGELDTDEKVAGCVLSKLAGAAFVKTSTGFGKGGATSEDIALMRRVVGPEMGVKASGGVRTFEDAEKMIKAGATRIGTSGGIAIVTGGENKGSY